MAAWFGLHHFAQCSTTTSDDDTYDLSLHFKLALATNLSVMISKIHFRTMFAQLVSVEKADRIVNIGAHL